MVAEIHAAEAAYPDIVDVMSIGRATQGRDIWVAKISDNVAVDEAEPEVLVDALHHARERLTVEQALYFLRALTADYATDPAVRALVDAREIWIVFSVNPDGARVRPRRQPVPPLAQEPPADPRLALRRHRPQPQLRLPVGLLRRLVGNPAAWNYRGPAPFSAPETRVIRDFVNSRRGRRPAADPGPRHAPHER